MVLDNKNQSPEESEEEKALEIIMKESERRKLKMAWEKKLIKNPNQFSNNKNKRRITKILGIVIVITLLLFCLNQVLNKESNLEETAYAMAIDTKTYYNADMATRGLNEQVDSNEKSVQEGIQDALSNGDLDLAIANFEALEKIKNLTLSESFNYAVLLVKSQNGDKIKAKNLLDQVLKANTPMHQEAMWYNALLLIQLEDDSKAQKTLIEIINSEYKNNEAKILLDIILNS